MPPPLFYALAFAAGMALQARAFPLSMGTSPERPILGAVAAGLGLVLAGTAVVHVHRHHSTVVPHRAVAVLITDGPFRLSRNPMYAGLAVAYVGGALLAASWWPLLTLPAALLAVRTLVIAPEERYLATRFSDSYPHHSGRTRRWV
ncbi:MAG: isoprenylcysteine carboxylmethyltransferase family protein [Lapillicoccus sp.]